MRTLITTLALGLVPLTLAVVASTKLLPYSSAASQDALQEQDPAPAPPPAPKPGTLIAVGSLQSFEAGMLETLGALEAASPSVIIVPHASDEEDRGMAAKKAFEAIGIDQVSILKNLDGQDTIELINQVDVIWFSDGSPSRLMNQLAASGLISNFYRWFKDGHLIGANGSTAGVFGIVYVEGFIEEPIMRYQGVKPRRGLGLWQGLMLPNMLKDNRIAHALSAGMDQTRLISLCMDNRSAVRIHGDDMFFSGPGSTLLIDPRKSKKTWIDEEAAHTVRDIKLSAFAAGESYRWYE